ncbi:MAG: DUF805 domain-containing protein [Alphaproteobacteria bacterium]|nr:DUF805 domain-containing protein [Alphaproteobacteria bacterium]
MFDYYMTCLKKYVDFSGRATRSEYWYFVLVNFLIGLVLALVNLDLLGSIYQLFVLIPGLAVFWRRMHDTNRSGANFFWLFLPIIGLIIVLIYLISPTKSGENKYVKGN